MSAHSSDGPARPRPSCRSAGPVRLVRDERRPLQHGDHLIDRRVRDRPTAPDSARREAVSRTAVRRGPSGSSGSLPASAVTGDSLPELMDDTYGGIGLRLGRAGDWTYSVAYGGRQGEFEFDLPARVSRDGAEVCLLEYEEENGKPVPPQFAYFRDGHLLSACNLRLNASWGYQGVDGDPATADRCRPAGPGVGPNRSAPHRVGRRREVLRALAARRPDRERHPGGRPAGTRLIHHQANGSPALPGGRPGSAAGRAHR